MLFNTIHKSICVRLDKLDFKKPARGAKFVNVIKVIVLYHGQWRKLQQA